MFFIILVVFLIFSKRSSNGKEDTNRNRNMHFYINANDLGKNPNLLMWKPNGLQQEDNEEVPAEDNIPILERLDISQGTLSYRKHRYDNYQENMLEVGVIIYPPYNLFQSNI